MSLTVCQLAVFPDSLQFFEGSYFPEKVGVWNAPHQDWAGVCRGWYCHEILMSYGKASSG